MLPLPSQFSTIHHSSLQVVSHSGFLKHLFALTGESSTAKVAPMDQHELRQRPLHAEMRSVLLAAHRKIDENEVRLYDG